ncbi:DUF3093 domain-containing protein [Frigoribacterium sp. CFBP 13729]|uniref:DUF3093 domain-containing protein n=1 Tax=unclassified Frigoribacterium TaxID=2627005 RepID=UPI00177AD8F2|nr:MULTISPECIES: DUF3093 domain-containing protein [unclassified Frigoribacterium]MBD8584520.1 DUF3093 domain-containing protein [Frigoribacterium sp. CFBP 8766]MBD8609279.1 DUF3093 domain-containing protein [Frigoribacterium sp. CFBP 13729]
MNPYRERLTPPATVFVATALVIPATLLVFLPIDQLVGVVVAVLFYAATVLALVFTSPVLRIDDEGFSAGRARLFPHEIGEVRGFSGAEATQQRGPRLDARAWTLFRGWVKPVVRITLTDETDPAPYWLVSTRRPDEVVRLLEALRQRTPGR